MTVIGSPDTLTVSNSSGDISVFLIICVEAAESTINSLSSGLAVEVGAAAPSNFVW